MLHLLAPLVAVRAPPRVSAGAAEEGATCGVRLCCGSLLSATVWTVWIVPRKPTMLSFPRVRRVVSVAAHAACS